MTKADLVGQLEAIKKSSVCEATAHLAADDLLLEYINDASVTTAFEAIDKWYE